VPLAPRSLISAAALRTMLARLSLSTAPP